MLQNASVAACTISELLRENQQDGAKLPPPPTPYPPRLGLTLRLNEEGSAAIVQI